MAKIAIVLGSIRTARIGAGVAEWVKDQAEGRSADYELVDLKDFELPLLDAEIVPAQANRHYGDPRVQAWGDKIGEFDGYVFVTAEYNQNIPGPFKNAFDSIGMEWAKKPVTFVGYSFHGAQNAIKGWRMTTSGLLDMQATDAEVNINIGEHFADGQFIGAEQLTHSLSLALDELEAKTATVAPATV